MSLGASFTSPKILLMTQRIGSTNRFQNLKTSLLHSSLDNAELLDPLLATSHNPEASQHYTRIPRHGRPRRLDAILVRQQIPNIPWTYYNIIRMPISDHSLVLIGLRWRTGGHTTTSPKPQPNVKRRYSQRPQSHHHRCTCGRGFRGKGQLAGVGPSPLKHVGKGGYPPPTVRFSEQTSNPRTMRTVSCGALSFFWPQPPNLLPRAHQSGSDLPS